MNFKKPQSWADLSELMGLDPDETAFMNSFPTRDGRIPITEPAGDFYLTKQGPFVLGNEESVAISSRLVPGHEDYLRREGLIKGELIQLDTRKKIEGLGSEVADFFDPALNKGLGYHNGSLDYTLLRAVESDIEVKRKLRGRRVFATFENADLARITKILGARNGMDANASFLANNKVEMRRGADRFGYKIADGNEAIDLHELCEKAQQLLASGYKKVWLKAATGYGGDLVRPATSYEEIGKAVQSLNQALDLAKNYSNGVDNKHFRHQFVVEGDLVDKAGVEKFLDNLNVQAVIGEKGVVPIGISMQHVSEKGAYLGNMFDDGSREVLAYKDLATEAVIRVGEWAKSLGYRGIIGIDLIIVQESGKPVAYMIDSNARPNASTSSLLMKNYLEAGVVLNANILLPEPVKDFDHAARLIGDSIYRRDKSGVLPKFFHAINDATNQLSSPQITCDIIGEDAGDVMNIVSRLRDLGIKI
jgi:hypothetical protein